MKKKSAPTRIDDELIKELKEFAMKNDLTIRQSSKIFAKEIKKKKLAREITF